MGEIRIHFKDIVVPFVQSPTEPGNIGCTKAQFAFSLDQIELLREFFLKSLNNIGRAVGGTVVNDQNMILSLQREYLAANALDILFFVVSRNYYKFAVHYLLISESISLTAASSCLSSPASRDSGLL